MAGWLAGQQRGMKKIPGHCSQPPDDRTVPGARPAPPERAWPARGGLFDCTYVCMYVCMYVCPAADTVYTRTYKHIHMYVWRWRVHGRAARSARALVHPSIHPSMGMPRQRQQPRAGPRRALPHIAPLLHMYARLHVCTYICICWCMMPGPGARTRSGVCMLAAGSSCAGAGNAQACPRPPWDGIQQQMFVRTYVHL